MRATLYVDDDPALLNNGIFFNEAFYGMKNCAFMIESLRQILARYGIELGTQDVFPPEKSDFVIGLDQTLPFQHSSWNVKPIYLILSEPATYFVHNWKAANHKVFNKVFTYNRQMVDEKKYFHYTFAIDLTENQLFYPTSREEFEARNLCVLMAASFGVVSPPAGSSSLLHERYLTLKWFAQNQPQDFDLYSREINPRTYRSFRGLGLLQKVLPARLLKIVADRVAAHHKGVFDIVNRGPVPHDGKIQALRRYRFNIAYENTGNLPGYLTEKMFDSFAACCVPIYWGDPDVASNVPKDCFIDRRNFASNADLYQYIRQMTYEQYCVHTDAITRFVTSGIAETEFGSEANAWRIAKVLLQDLGITVPEKLPAS